MGCLGNFLWFICGGLVSGLSWLVMGVLWCVTIVGIPVGLQCFKFASLSFFPFGKDIEYSDSSVSFIINLIWIIFSGAMLAIEHVLFGLILCVTVIGIPFGFQYFKLAKLALMPFGATVKNVE